MIARRPLEAVVFDAGGTLVRLDFEWMAEHLAELGQAIPAEALRRAEVEGRRRYDASVGRAVAPGAPQPPLGSSGDTSAYFGGMLEAAGVARAAIAGVLDHWYARHRAFGLWNRPMEGARAAVDALAAQGLRLAVVSNSDGRAERHLTDTGMRSGLEFVVDSQRVGIEKPDPGIFRVALARLGVDAGRALYVGDIRSVDEAGARAAGMPFVLVDPFGDYGVPGGPAIRELESLPAWVADAFEVVPARGRAGAARTSTTPGEAE